MACGSVAQAESAINLASLNLTRRDLTSSSSSSASSDKGDASPNKIPKPKSRGEDLHEAILFLQKEHEFVLTGLHKQIELLQRKCDDLHFDAHLKHIVSNDEDILRKKLTEMKNIVSEKNKELARFKEQLGQREKLLDEEKEQHRWKELKLQQQVEVGNQRTAELKTEVARLRGQVHDLKVFSSALRTSSNVPHSSAQRHWSASKIALSSIKSSSGSQYKSSQESLDSQGPKSLGSEEGDMGTWREARLGSGGSKLSSLRGSARPQSTSSHLGSLPPLSPSPAGSRPSSSISSSFTLPPINPSDTPKNVQNRPYVRKQLRLLSAPHLDLSLKSPKYPP